MVSATTLIADYYSGSARAAFMLLQAGFMGLSGVVFLTVGGAAQQNWHYPFGIYLFAWPIAILVLMFISEPNSAEPMLRERGDSAHPNINVETEPVIDCVIEPPYSTILTNGAETFSQSSGEFS